MEEEYGLSKFDPKCMPITSVAVFVARRGMGKSTACEDLLYNLRYKVPLVTVFSPTEATDPFFSKFIPDAFIYNELNMEALEQIRKRQRTVLASPPPGVTDPTCLIILDDCMYKKSLFNHELIRYIIMNGRHDGLGLWIISQYVSDLPPYIRANADFVFAFKDNVRTNRENMWKMFFGVVPSFPVFDPIHKFYTDNYGILVLNNRERSQDEKKMLFWYTAKPIQEKWRLGPQAGDMYKFQEMHYVENKANIVDWNKFEMSSLKKPETVTTKKKGQLVLRRLGVDGKPLE